MLTKDCKELYLTLKLSKRLTQLEALITHDYTHIWDTCCDHGLLGTQLIAQQKAPNIHLVDIVPELIAALDEKLTRLFSNPYSSPSVSVPPTSVPPTSLPTTYWQTHCLDVSALPLQQHKGRHLIIIAGIGGDLMIQCVQGILNKNPTAEIDFLLCPIRQIYALRQQLIALKMKLKHEVLVKENNKFYEILLVTTDNNPQLSPITNVGCEIWQGENQEQVRVAQQYLEKTQQHYQRMQRGTDNSALNEIIQGYQSINIAANQIKLPR